MRLREAASTIFALTAILPLLILVYFMWRFGLLESTEAQLGIFLALIIALLGYVLFRRLTSRVAELGRALGQVVMAPPASATAATPGAVPAVQPPLPARRWAAVLTCTFATKVMIIPQ